MIVVVDERKLVKDGYTALFGREGIPSTGFDPVEFGEWVTTAADSDVAAIEAFLIGQAEMTQELPRAIRDRSQAPVIAVSDHHSLDATLALFDWRGRCRPQASSSKRDLGACSCHSSPLVGVDEFHGCRSDQSVFGWTRSRGQWRAFRIAASRAPYSGIPNRKSRSSRFQVPDFQRDLWHFRRGSRRERRREPHQQIA